MQWTPTGRCDIEQERPERTGEESIPSVLDVVVPALERSSALADRLAQLLLPARLFT
jgi:hypothetical protein